MARNRKTPVVDEESLKNSQRHRNIAITLWLVVATRVNIFLNAIATIIV
ncbi:hypothetical protein H6G96_37750 [Nostoc sp. FACHB-892]|nr:hypothetical protein [Nostoc sp. FACHB-892]MBD2731864.1 hypothetical protein [Nostoc sp. FACHB-892]